MARVRLLNPDTFMDEDLATLSISARFLFLALWTQADREGRLEDRPMKIRAGVFPYEPVDVDALLNELAKAKPNGGTFLSRYVADGQKVIQITNFLKYQKPHQREAPSNLPAERLAQGKPRHALGETSRPVSISNPVCDTDSVPVTDPDPVEVDRLDSEIAFEERRFASLAVPIRDTIQQVLDSLPRPASRSPFSASRWLRTGLTGIPRTEGALTVLRLTNDALEARQRAQDAPYMSDKNRISFDSIDRVLGTGAYADGSRPLRAVEGGVK